MFCYMHPGYKLFCCHTLSFNLVLFHQHFVRSVHFYFAFGHYLNLETQIEGRLCAFECIIKFDH